jgi:hypothetical protein
MGLYLRERLDPLSKIGAARGRLSRCIRGRCRGRQLAGKPLRNGQRTRRPGEGWARPAGGTR